MDLILSLPSATAECERGFSQMKLTKSQYRNKLRSSSLTLLMTIQLHSNSIESFDPTPAIHTWNRNANKSRRPTFLPKSRRNMSRHISSLDDHLKEMEAVEPVAEKPDASADRDDVEDSDYDSNFSDMDSDTSDID